MKNNIFFIVLIPIFALLSTANTAKAQINSHIESIPTQYGNFYNAIGRVSPVNDSIIYSYHHWGTGEFIETNIYATTPPQSRKFDVPKGFTIYDFEILNETIYFCGAYQDSAIIGYFPIDAFTTGFYPSTGTINPSVAFSYALIPKIEKLTKMDVVDSSGVTIVAAVRNMSSLPGYFDNGIFLFRFNSSTVNYSYKIYLNYPVNPFYNDIAITDNYYVCSGAFYNGSTMIIAMTYIEKTNPSIFYYQLYVETAGDMNSCFYSIEHTVGDEVVISSLVHNTGSSAYYIPIHVYDVSIQSFTSSQIIPVLEKTQYNNKMLFFSEDSTLLLLNTNCYPSNNYTNSVIYNLKPYANSSYTTNTIYDTTSRYNSLARFSNDFFLATGEDLVKGHSFFIKDRLAPFVSKCFESQSHLVTPIARPTGFAPNHDSLSYSNSTIKNDYPNVDELPTANPCTDNRRNP